MWLGNVLRMPTQKLLRCTLFAEAVDCWKVSGSGESMTWQSRLTTLIKGLARVGKVRLQGWGPRHPLSPNEDWKQWLIWFTSTRNGFLAFKVFLLYICSACILATIFSCFSFAFSPLSRLRLEVPVKARARQFRINCCKETET